MASYNYEISSSLDVIEAMQEAADFMAEMAELAEHGELELEEVQGLLAANVILNSEEGSGEELEAFAGYYIYHMDEASNQYSIGVYGN